MRRFPSRMLLGCITLLSSIVSAQEYLPTPYTAEEIREAWQVGFELTTHHMTPEGEEISMTRVEAWSQGKVEMSAVTFDIAGDPKGEPRLVESTWEELRDHARFPSAIAARERAQRETVMGELEGWLYRVAGEEGRRSEFFFADGLPGPPVVYSHFEGDAEVLRVEMIDRQEAESAVDQD